MNQTQLTFDPDHPVPNPAQDDRIAAILASVRVAFAAKGFDGASMQDLARAAGMSVGNFYRYFPSKTAIVAAMIEADLCMIEADFAMLMTADRPLDLLRAQLPDKLPQHQACKDGDLWSEITAVARRNSEIGAVAVRMEARIRDRFFDVIARHTGLPLDEVTTRFGAETAFILLLFKASNASSDTDASLRGHLNDLIIRTIDQTLDNIAQSARNP